MAVRKNQSELTPQERENFVNALLQLKADGTYDEFVQTHVDAMKPATPQNVPMSVRNAAHRGPSFLPWHREYLRRFELALQEIDPSVSLPYWDWTVDNSPSSSIWNGDFMGGDGSGLERVVSTGPFAHKAGNWILKVNTSPSAGPELKRQFGVFGTSLPSTADVEDCISVTPYDSSPWDRTSNPSFRNLLEGWIGPSQIHNRVHGWVGGSMLPGSSPNDPIFFLHHCNVDRLWAIWQSQHTNENYLPVSGGPAGHNLNDSMFPWGGTTTPASVLDISTLGYSYDNMPLSTVIEKPVIGKTEFIPLKTQNRCFIATAAYGSELEPPVQFLREFRDNVVLKSRFQQPFDDILNVYYKFSPPVADLMRRNKPFKYAMKYSIVWPFVALTQTTAFIIKPFINKNEESNSGE